MRIFSAGNAGTWIRKNEYWLEGLVVAGFVAGIMINYFLSAKSILIFFTVGGTAYYLFRFAYLVRREQELTTMEVLVSQLAGLLISLLMLGAMLKMTGNRQKDFLLHIALIFSILLLVIVCLYVLARSQQLRLQKIPFLRHCLFSVAGIVLFMIPLRQSEVFLQPPVVVPQETETPVFQSATSDEKEESEDTVFADKKTTEDTLSD